MFDHAVLSVAWMSRREGWPVRNCSRPIVIGCTTIGVRRNMLVIYLRKVVQVLRSNRPRTYGAMRRGMLIVLILLGL